MDACSGNMNRSFEECLIWIKDIAETGCLDVQVYNAVDQSATIFAAEMTFPHR